jgi:multidrug efflux pump subunit AcrB
MLGTVEEFESILISAEDSERLIYLRDVATVRRAYQDPPSAVARYDGKRGIGIGISTISGGNAVLMGDAVQKRWEELLGETPAGIEVGIVSLQSEAVVTAIFGFLTSLIEAVVIVIVVLMAFMGLRSALLIGFILFVTICGTFVFMAPWGVALERISLGALIISLGMLVDNAIVVVDGMLMKLGEGKDAETAAEEVVQQQAMPLLGATAVAIIAFAAIGVSQDSTGEYCRSLFQVVFLALGLSWVTAVTITPLLGVMFLKAPARKEGQEEGDDPYAGQFYTYYKTFLAFCIRQRFATVGLVLAIFGVSLYGFGYVDTTFFPNSTRPQFMVEYWLPMGTQIKQTDAEVHEAEKYLMDLPGVKHVSSFVGQGGLRFLLTYTPEQPDPAYAQFLVDVEDYRTIDDLVERIGEEMPDRFPDAIVYGKKFLLGPGEGGKIQVRVTGDDHQELRRLAVKIENLMYEDGGAKGVRNDWRERVKIMRPAFSPEQASITGIDLPDIADAVRLGFEGIQTGVFRDRDELIPIVLRSPQEERLEISNLRNLQIYSPTVNAFIPIRQVVSSFDTVYEDGIVMRRNRKPTITVHCDQKTGTASVLLNRLMPQIAEIPLPPARSTASRHWPTAFPSSCS